MHINKISLAILIGLLLAPAAQLPGARAQNMQAHQQSPTATLPSDTDPAIKTFNDPHLSWLPQDKPRGQLVVFLPGTHGVPHEMPFAETAAQLGYHVIFLMYPDAVAAQQVAANSDDQQADLNFRREIIEGGNLSPLIQIDRADSIENRLAKLLSYLNAHQPENGWGQFFSKQGIDWSKLVLAGQSQGGGHAYVISKYHPVARVIMFGSPKDYNLRLQEPAGGFDSRTATPLNRYFAFNHLQDAIAGCNHNRQMQIFQQMGLVALGSATANGSSNFNHAHLLFTDLEVQDPQNRKQYHGSVINPRYQQITKPAWIYMLTEPVK